MNAVLIILPIFFIRYGLLGYLNIDALQRASFFAPLIGVEKVAYWIYQLTTVAIVIILLFLRVNTGSKYFYIGLFVYIIGIVLYIITTINYAKPKSNGLNLNGMYKISRNPMYIAYFINLLGCAILTHSLIVLMLLIIFQISSHWIIHSEEKWCIQKFGDEYKNYMKSVRRYI